MILSLATRQPAVPRSFHAHESSTPLRSCAAAAAAPSATRAATMWDRRRNIMRKRWIVLTIVMAVTAAAPAEAQSFEAFEETRWGVHVSLTPEWMASDPFRYLVGADEIVDWRGSDYSIGFVRGRATGGEWGLSRLRQRVEADSLLCLSAGGVGGECYDPVEATGDVRLQGFEFHWFTPFAKFAGDRVQLAVNPAAGAGWYDGMVRRPAADAGLAVEAADVLRFRGPDGQEGHHVVDGFARAVALSVLATNLHRIGLILQKRERKRRRRVA